MLASGNGSVIALHLGDHKAYLDFGSGLAVRATAPTTKIARDGLFVALPTDVQQAFDIISLQHLLDSRLQRGFVAVLSLARCGRGR
jgi:hypothetical protein